MIYPIEYIFYFSKNFFRLLLFVELWKVRFLMKLKFELNREPSNAKPNLFTVTNPEIQQARTPNKNIKLVHQAILLFTGL